MKGLVQQIKERSFMKQRLFEFFVEEHGLTLTQSQKDDIIDEVKKAIGFQELIEDAFDEGVDQEMHYQQDELPKVYQNGRDYFEKTFKTI